MQVIDTKIDGVKVIQPTVFSDTRGFFMETFEKRRFQDMLDIDLDFVQDNYSRSSRGGFARTALSRYQAARQVGSCGARRSL